MALRPAHISTVWKLTYADGTESVAKPASGERSALRDDGTPGYQTEREVGPYNITWGYQTEREVGAWKLAELVGMGILVAPAVDGTFHGERAAVIAWMPGERASRLAPTERYGGSRDLARSAAFDYIIGNEDRHTGKWLVGDGKLHLVDHNLAFPDKDGYYPVNDALIREADRRCLGSPSKYAAAYLKARGKILRTLGAVGLPEGSIRGADERITKLN